MTDSRAADTVSGADSAPLSGAPPLPQRLPPLIGAE